MVCDKCGGEEKREVEVNEQYYDNTYTCRDCGSIRNEQTERISVSRAFPIGYIV